MTIIATIRGNIALSLFSACVVVLNLAMVSFAIYRFVELQAYYDTPAGQAEQAQIKKKSDELRTLHSGDLILIEEWTGVVLHGSLEGVRVRSARGREGMVGYDSPLVLKTSICARIGDPIYTDCALRFVQQQYQ